MSQGAQWVLSFAVVGGLAGLFVFLMVGLAPHAASPPVLHAPVSSDPSTMLGVVDFSRRSTGEIVMAKPGVYGDRLVHAWETLAALPWEQQPSAQQQWMARQVHEAVNEALGKVGYQASEQNLADGQFYVIEKKRKTP